MKLYTEETVRFIAKAIYTHDFDPAKSPTELVKELIPIKLPSNEEIENMSTNYTEDHQYSYKLAFQKGAKWMKEQILSQNK